MRTRELDRAIQSSGTGKLYLFLVNPEHRLEANLTALKKAVGIDRPFTYVMARYPYPKLQGALTELGANDGRNAFIDARTKTVSKDVDLEQQQVMYVKSPQNLVNISTSISVAANEGGNGMVVLDSLSALNSYNTVDDVGSFLENMRGRLKTLESNAIIFQDFKEGDWPPKEILEHIDEVISLYEGDLESCSLTKTDDGFSLTIPDYIVEALAWEEDEPLTITVTDNGIEVLEE